MLYICIAIETVLVALVGGATFYIFSLPYRISASEVQFLAEVYLVGNVCGIAAWVFGLLTVVLYRSLKRQLGRNLPQWLSLVFKALTIINLIFTGLYFSHVRIGAQ